MSFSYPIIWQVFIKHLLPASHTLILAGLSSPTLTPYTLFSLLRLYISWSWPILVLSYASAQAAPVGSTPLLHNQTSKFCPASRTTRVPLPLWNISRFPQVSINHFSDHLPFLHPQEELAVPLSVFLAQPCSAHICYFFIPWDYYFIATLPQIKTRAFSPSSTLSLKQSNHSEYLWVKGHMNIFFAVPMALCTHN